MSLIPWTRGITFEIDTDEETNWYIKFTDLLAANPDIPSSVEQTIDTVEIIESEGIQATELAHDDKTVDFKVWNLTAAKASVTIRITTLLSVETWDRTIYFKRVVN